MSLKKLGRYKHRLFALLAYVRDEAAKYPRPKVESYASNITLI
jgi:hypothetical protein